MPDATNSTSKPDPNQKLVTVFDTEQEPEALLVQGLLESAGITSELKAIDVTQDAFPGLGGVVLLVGDEDAEAAAKIIEAYRQSPPVDDETAELTG